MTLGRKMLVAFGCAFTLLLTGLSIHFNIESKKTVYALEESFLRHKIDGFFITQVKPRYDLLVNTDLISNPKMVEAYQKEIFNLLNGSQELVAIYSGGKLVFAKDDRSIYEEEKFLTKLKSVSDTGFYQTTIFETEAGIFAGTYFKKWDWHIVLGRSIESITSAVNKTFYKSISFIGISVIALLVVLALFVRKGILRPINNLVTYTEAVSQQNFDQKIEYAKDDEFSHVYEKLHAMSEAIKGHLLEKEKWRQTLEEKISQRTKELHSANRALEITNFKLKRSTKEAEKANVAKTAFLANMSHELRTPLNAIIGYSEILLEDAKEEGHEHFCEDIEKIHASGLHLLNLVNEVLDIAKIEANEFKLYLAEFSINEVFERLKDILTPLMELNGNKFEIEANIKDLKFVSDKQRIQQILINLLSNAAKFTSQGFCKLVVSDDSIGDKKGLFFEVIDNGAGISKDNQKRIFDKFVQVHDISNDKLAGTGLGLPLVKNFVEQLGGHLGLESEIGKGSRFYFGLPCFDSKDISRDRSHVLLVDDDKDVRDYLSDILSAYCDCSVAGEGDTAIDLLESNRFDAMVVDLQMPGLNGMSLIKLIQNRGLNPAKIFLLTGADIRKDLEYSNSLEIDGILSKPLNEKELIMAVVGEDAFKEAI